MWHKNNIELLGKSNFNILRRKSIGIVGFGGVGSVIFEILARFGVKSFRLFDENKITTHDINRNLYSNLTSVGKYKVVVAKEHMRTTIPEVEVQTFVKNVGIKDSHLFKGLDLVVISTGGELSNKLEIEKTVRDNNIPIMFVGVNGFTYFASFFLPTDKWSIKDLFFSSTGERFYTPEEYPSGSSTACAISGAIVAQNTVNFLTDCGPYLHDMILMGNIRNGSYKIHHFNDWYEYACKHTKETG